MDTNYVVLDLETYNSLYDKARIYDAMYTQVETNEELFEDNSSDVESNSTEEWDVVMNSDSYGIPRGAKGKILEPNERVPYIKWDKNYRCTFVKEVNGVVYDNVFAMYRSDLKFINESEDK